MDDLCRRLDEGGACNSCSVDGTPDGVEACVQGASCKASRLELCGAIPLSAGDLASPEEMPGLVDTRASVAKGAKPEGEYAVSLASFSERSGVCAESSCWNGVEPASSVKLEKR